MAVGFVVSTNAVFVFRVMTVIAGFFPALLFCVGAFFLVEDFVSHPGRSEIFPFFLGLGGFAGTLGFAVAALYPGRYRALTIVLLSWGIISLSTLWIGGPSWGLWGHVLVVVILAVGAANVVVAMTHKMPE